MAGLPEYLGTSTSAIGDPSGAFEFVSIRHPMMRDATSTSRSLPLTLSMSTMAGSYKVP